MNDEAPKRRRHARVRTQPAAGSDPTPRIPDSADTDVPPESPGDAATGNDEQLRRDVPPHW